MNTQPNNSTLFPPIYYCNNEKLDKMNKGIYDRNLPSQSLQMVFDPRQVQTRYVKFPMIDCKPQHKEAVENRSPYVQDKQFNPGTSAPYQGFASNVDQDSSLRNMFMPLQKYTGQTQFIPSSQSDLYHTKVATSQPVTMNHEMLFQQPVFAPFNPNPCNLGGGVLYNHTRQQVKDLSLHKK